ncbi:hypothetical protein [Kitasatospora griseola]|uniref:hypothetical protein n=1 Tax=Kitasatospora griseola TaxID=2064 RepID=UPI0038300CB6
MVAPVGLVLQLLLEGVAFKVLLLAFGPFLLAVPSKRLAFAGGLAFGEIGLDPGRLLRVGRVLLDEEFLSRCQQPSVLDGRVGCARLTGTSDRCRLRRLGLCELCLLFRQKRLRQQLRHRLAPRQRPSLSSSAGSATAHAWRTCAGWLATVGDFHFGIRIALATGSLPRDAATPSPNWPALYPSLDALLNTRQQHLHRRTASEDDPNCSSR